MVEIRSALKISTIEAMFATIHVALTQGIFLTNYVLDLGASNLVCGIVESLPFLLQFSFFLSPILVRKIQSRRIVTGIFAFAHRLSWLVLIMLLYVDWDPWIKHGLMIFTLFVSNMCAVIATNAWFSWMADLIPASIRGTYYGRRNAYLGLTSLVALLAGSQVLNWFKSVGMVEAGYTICFAVAIASAVFAVRKLLQQYEPPTQDIPKVSFAELRRALADQPLLKSYIRFFTIWQFGLGVGAAFFGVHMVKVLHMTPAQMGYFAILSSVTALFGSRLWGRARDRVGDRAVLISSGLLVSVHIVVWMWAYDGFLLPVWMVCIFGGFSWAGFNIAAWNWPQHLCRDANRQYTYGLIGLYSGPGFVAGSILGGILTTYLPLTLFSWGGFDFLHFHLVFTISLVARGLAVLLIARWSFDHDRRHRSISECFVDSFRAMRA